MPPPPRPLQKGDTGSPSFITPPRAVTGPLGSTQTRPTILRSTNIPGSHLMAPLFLVQYPTTPAPTHQSCQGRAEQARKPTHLGWVLKTQDGALHPSSSSAQMFSASSPPLQTIGEARPRAVPQGLPKSPLRPAPGWTAAPAFPAVVEVGQRRGQWPRTLLLGHRGLLCPSPGRWAWPQTRPPGLTRP